MWIVAVLAGCEHIDEIVDVGTPAMPVSTAETQRINVDEIGPKVVRHAGVGPVRVSSLADPAFTLPRQQVSAFEDEPPPAPIVRTAAQQWFATLSATDRKTVREICVEGRRDPCFGMLPRPRGAQPSRMETLLAKLPDGRSMERSSVVHDYCHERDPGIICDTPLVVAFDGEVAFEPSHAAFEFQPGIPVRSDWPSAASPWIALDRDGDGAITSGAELFGDATGTARNGFEALAALDANHDGVIDRRDPMFERLLLWSDRDGDHRSSPSELSPLASVIASLPLAHEVVSRCVNGNCEGERAAIEWRDERGHARRGAVIDVYLRRRF